RAREGTGPRSSPSAYGGRRGSGLDPMIMVKRTYTLHPGKVTPFLGIGVRRGTHHPATSSGAPLGNFTSESGAVNHVVHLQGFNSADDRERRRTALGTDPAWQAFG